MKVHIKLRNKTTGDYNAFILFSTLCMAMNIKPVKKSMGDTDSEGYTKLTLELPSFKKGPRK